MTVTVMMSHDKREIVKRERLDGSAEGKSATQT